MSMYQGKGGVPEVVLGEFDDQYLQMLSETTG